MKVDVSRFEWYIKRFGCSSSQPTEGTAAKRLATRLQNGGENFVNAAAGSVEIRSASRLYPFRPPLGSRSAVPLSAAAAARCPREYRSLAVL